MKKPSIRPYLVAIRQLMAVTRGLRTEIDQALEAGEIGQAMRLTTQLRARQDAVLSILDRLDLDGSLLTLEATLPLNLGGSSVRGGDSA